MNTLDKKITSTFPGKVVRKDLTAIMKRGSNIPTYVLEYLLGMYCASDDDQIINAGLEKIRKILTDNYVRADESEKIKSYIREKGEYTIVDKVSVSLNENTDVYMATLTNLEIRPFPISSDIVINNEKLLTGGVWCILRIAYIRREESVDSSWDMFSEKREMQKKAKYESPFKIVSLKPIQMPNLDIDEIIEARKTFTTKEWIDLLLRSEGYEADNLSSKEKMHFLLRLVPLIQKNYNLVELGPRGTGKSHLYQELSPYSILISGGKTSVSNMFYNMQTRHVGLVGHWDCIAFDEVAGMKLKDSETIPILKNYMANGAFARGQNAINADASICFEGNINDTVQNLLKTSHLFMPFPDELNNDSAFFDRIHYYLPGWETPKLKSDLLTKRFGFITDCLSEFCKGMRKFDYSHAFDMYYSLNGQFNKRDEIAVRSTFSGLAKLIYPDGVMLKEDVKEILEYAIEGRRRVKEQLKIIAGAEFIDTALGYIDNITDEEKIIILPEQREDALVPEFVLPAGHVYTAGKIEKGSGVAVFKLENKVINGTGKFKIQGIPPFRSTIEDCLNSAFVYFGENAKKVIPNIRQTEKDYLLYYAAPQEGDLSDEISVAEFIGLCSAVSNIPILKSLVVIGDFKLSGTMTPIKNIDALIRVSVNAGARNILLPQSVIRDLQNINNEILENSNLIFYSDPIDAAKKVLML